MKECDNRTIIDLNGTSPRVAVSQAGPCSGCGNLLQNPSFEAGMDGWAASNVFAADSGAFEGLQLARMGSGVASLYQDVRLPDASRNPLLLSFNLLLSDPAAIVSDMTAEVLWLDANKNRIGTGLRLFVPQGRIFAITRQTYFSVTDRPPAGAAGARLLFTKGASSSENPGNDFIDLDMMTLAPIAGGNLLRNPGFEEGLQGWNAVETEVSFRNSFEGAATAGMSDPFNMLWQDVPLAGIPAGSAFLFGFAAQSSFPGNFQVQVQWRDAAGNSIGQPGFVMVIGGALVEHVDYYSYLALTGPSPVGAATARVLFTASGAPNLNIFIDAVLFARAGSPNLVQNPGFENGLTNWQGGNVSAGPSDAAYEGERRARIEADGGFLAQNIPLEGAAGRCFLLNFAAGFTDAESPLPGTLLAEVIWFDRSGQEVGNGLSLVVQNIEVTETRWYNYTGVTEPAPPGTTVARISFTKGGSDEATGIIDFDLVEFGRLV